MLLSILHRSLGKAAAAAANLQMLLMPRDGGWDGRFGVLQFCSARGVNKVASRANLELKLPTPNKIRFIEDAKNHIFSL